tara:strand:- start:490 stop:861 length:372 start_codon:yes stop_codon:yes gene_type:complete
LREKYDGPTTETMNEQQWRAKIDSKMYTVLVDKTKAMLVSKSTKKSHSQWEGSLDHDNFIVLQKMQRGQVTEAFSHMMSSVEDRLNFAEAAEDVLALYDAADEEGGKEGGSSSSSTRLRYVKS